MNHTQARNTTPAPRGTGSGRPPPPATGLAQAAPTIPITTLVDQTEPLLIPVTGVAQACGLSARTIRRLDAAGKLPRAIMLGGSKRWRAEEVRDWVRAGCPSRKAWESMSKHS